MELDRYTTQDIYTGGKKELFENNAPAVRLLQEIDEIVFGDPGQILPETSISLKDLFKREKIDEYHVNTEILMNFSLKVIDIQNKLAERGFCVGLYDLADFYSNPAENFSKICLCRPERFQLLNFEQDYEWFPEDEKIFGNITLFSEGEQRLADCRLVFKILTAAVKGNVKVPPKMNDADYSDIFYCKLSPALRSFFENAEEADRDKLKSIIKNSLEELLLKKEISAQSGESVKRSKRSGEQNNPTPSEQSNFRCMYLLLRTDLRQSVKIGRMLYDLEDAIELESRLSGKKLEQSYIHGDGLILVRKFQADPPYFRAQMKNQIRNYAAGEAMIIAAEYLTSVITKSQNEEISDMRCIILFDGELQNNNLFQYGVEKLEALKALGVHFYLTSDQYYTGEACQRLCKLVNRQEDYYVVRSAEKI